MPPPNRKKRKGGGGPGAGGVSLIYDILIDNSSVTEGSSPGTLVGNLTPIPGAAELSLVDDGGGRFALAPNGQLIVAGDIDYEDDTQVLIVVRAVNGAGSFDKPILITIINVNETPATTLDTFTIPEGSAAGTLVGTLSNALPGASFVLIDTAGNRFAVDGAALEAGAVATDYETATSHQVTVRTTVDGESRDDVFVILVTNVNEITNITLTPATIPENSAAGTLVGALASVPPGATFTLTDAAGNRFALDGGNIEAGAVATNYEGATSHQITVEAQLGSDTFSKVITITVTDVDEVNDITLSNNSIAENSTAGTVVGALTSNPSGATFSMVDTAGSRFAISGNNLVAGSVATNYEGSTSHQVTIRATRQGETYDEVFTINVTDQDEVNDISLSNNSIQENSGSGTVVGALTSNPSGATFSMVDTAGSRFAISGNNLVAGSVATNYESSTSHQVTIRATRQGETYDEVFTINVSNVTEISSISLSPSTINEGTGATQNIGTVSTSPPGASISVIDAARGHNFGMSGATLQKTVTYDPYPYMPDFPLYSAGRPQLLLRAQAGGETLDQNVLLTVNPAANNTIDASHNTTSASNTSNTGTPPSVALSHSSTNGTGPFSHGWQSYLNDPRIEILNSSTSAVTVRLAAGTARPVTVVDYIISSIVDVNGQFGWAWTQVTLTWN